MKKYFVFLLFFLWCIPAFACDSSRCTLSREAVSRPEGASKLFADFTVEQINWDEKDARDAHALHHDGHHFHDKTYEELYHFTLGASPAERLTVLAEIPYVVRGSIEVDSHARLGNRENSEGWGDLSLTGIWRFVQEEAGVLGWLAGVKLPTGETEELNSGGVLFEPELQPGTGSTDATLGLVGQKSWGLADLRGNVRYTWKGKGDHDFRFGNKMDAHLALERTINPGGRFPLKVGANAEWMVEARQNHSGERIEDSGGNTVLLGPSLEAGHGTVTLFANFLLPVYQNLGGVHQELDFVWNAGAKVRW